MPAKSAWVACLFLLCMHANVKGVSSSLSYVTSPDVDVSLYRNRLSLCPTMHTSELGSFDTSSCVCRNGYTVSGSSCVECAANTVKTEAGNIACTHCGDNAESLPGSTEFTSCLCGLGYQPDAQACSACDTEHYKPYTGNATCTACPSNTKAEEEGASAITDCVCTPGFEGPAGGACTACAAGKFKDVLSSTQDCVQCPAFATTSDTASVQFSDCLCMAGYTIKPGTTRPPLQCEACSAGKYKTTLGEEECAVCPDNTDTVGTGSNTVLQCLCNPGYVGINPTACTQCSAGTYKAGLGDGTCQACDPNTYSLAGASICSPCPAHSQSGEGAAACVCSQGYHRVDGTCQACPAGTFKSGAGDASALCLPCAEGTFSVAGSNECALCPEHSVTGTADPGDVSSCWCQSGYEYYAGSCTSCSAGKFKASISNTDACVECHADTYEPDDAAAGCNGCPAGSSTYTATGSTSVDACLCTAGYEPDGDGCKQCTADFYCPGNDVKTACPVHGLSPANSDEVTDCYCEAGYYFTTESGAKCEECPQDHYCPEGTSVPVDCMQDSSAPKKSTSEDACVCDVGYRAVE